jgi:GT2 family glycosyltransferase
MPRVSAAVLNYNGRALLEVILPSLVAQDYLDFEILVVDNGSTDDSLDYVREHWPRMRLVTVGAENVGVAAALNLAVSSCRGELIALLNNDIELDPRWLSELVLSLDRHPHAGMVACKLMRYRERDVLDGAGNVFMRSATGWQRGQGQRDVGQFEAEEEVFAPTAGAALYRAQAFAEVGPFDESFWAYFEDVDWGLRAQIAGLRCWYAPKAIAFHMGSQTTKGDANPLYFELQRRNTLALLVKDVPVAFMLRNVHRILFHHVLGLLYSARAGMLGLHLRSVRSAWRAAPTWRAQRREILGRRRIRLSEFNRFVSKRR